MSYIYKITNDINNKVYIGKTAFSIEKRFKEHCGDAYRSRNEKRPLYAAIQKYGIEHFQIEQLEECSDYEAADREAYWISYYKAYSKGYNATLGGDGKFLNNHEANRLRLLEHSYPIDIDEEFDCCRDIVYDIAHKYNIPVRNKGIEQMAIQKSKKIGCYSKTGELIKEFPSTVEAGKWCFENHYCATLNSGVRGHIADCANGKRKTAYKYIWKYL